MFAPSWRVAQEILERVGLPTENVVNISFECPMDWKPTLTVRRLVTNEQLNALVEVIEQYDLHKKEQLSKEEERGKK